MIERIDLRVVHRLETRTMHFLDMWHWRFVSVKSRWSTACKCCAVSSRVKVGANIRERERRAMPAGSHVRSLINFPTRAPKAISFQERLSEPDEKSARSRSRTYLSDRARCSWFVNMTKATTHRKQLMFS